MERMKSKKALKSQLLKELAKLPNVKVLTAEESAQVVASMESIPGTCIARPKTETTINTREVTQ